MVGHSGNSSLNLEYLVEDRRSESLPESKIKDDMPVERLIVAIRERGERKPREENENRISQRNREKIDTHGEEEVFVVNCERQCHLERE